MLLLASCSQSTVEENIPSTPVSPTTETRTLHILAQMPEGGASSRVAFADAEGLQWQAEDATKVGVRHLAAGAWATAQTTQESAITGNGAQQRADFVAEVAADATEAYFYYPYDESAADDTTKHTFEFAASRIQQAAGCGENFALVSDAQSIEGAASVAPQFRMAGAAVRYFIYDSEGCTENVESVALEADTALACTSYTLDMATGKAVASGSTSNSVTVALQQPYALEGKTQATAAQSIFVPIIPAATTGYKYRVTTDRNIYEFAASGERTWADATIYEVKLNLAKATSVTPVAAKTRLDYLFTSKGVIKDTSIEFGAGGGDRSLGWYIVQVDGKDNTDYNAEYYKKLRFEARTADGTVADWVSGCINGNNDLRIKCAAASSEDRAATLYVYFDGDKSVYEVKSTDGKAITSEDPIYSIEIKQPGRSEKIRLDYKFTTKGVTKDTSREFGTEGGEQDLGWYIVALDGTDNTDYNAEYYKKLRFEARTADNTAADWASGYVKGNNDLVITCSPASSEDRTATLYVYFDGDKNLYEVKSTDDKAITSEDPIYSIKIEQKGGTVAKKTIRYEFNGIPSEAKFTEGDERQLGYILAYVNGGLVGDGADMNTYGRIRAVSSEDWCHVSYDPSARRNYLYVSCDAPVAAERTAAVSFYFEENDLYEIEGDATQPLYTVTVTQEAIITEHEAEATFDVWDASIGGLIFTPRCTREITGGGDLQSDGASLKFDGIGIDRSDPRFEWVRFDSDSDWLNAETQAGKSEYLIHCADIDAAAESRTGIIKVRLNVPASESGTYTVISPVDGEEGVLLTITVTQHAR